ncbi:hypothetical protein LTR17_018075 [Elasticomyces elasticus]|nr:hypothetical protein LTR17_018075 [Elasticomyces elasticus]
MVDTGQTIKGVQTSALLAGPTASPSTQASVDPVLLTTELLEGLLHLLPMRDLLLAQRVSRKFRDVIGRSMVLQ